MTLVEELNLKMVKDTLRGNCRPNIQQITEEQFTDNKDELRNARWRNLWSTNYEAMVTLVKNE